MDETRNDSSGESDTESAEQSQTDLHNTMKRELVETWKTSDISGQLTLETNDEVRQWHALFAAQQYKIDEKDRWCFPLVKKIIFGSAVTVVPGGFWADPYGQMRDKEVKLQEIQFDKNSSILVGSYAFVHCDALKKVINSDRIVFFGSSSFRKLGVTSQMRTQLHQDETICQAVMPMALISIAINGKTNPAKQNAARLGTQNKYESIQWTHDGVGQIRQPNPALGSKELEETVKKRLMALDKVLATLTEGGLDYATRVHVHETLAKLLVTDSTVFFQKLLSDAFPRIMTASGTLKGGTLKRRRKEKLQNSEADNASKSPDNTPKRLHTASVLFNHLQPQR